MDFFTADLHLDHDKAISYWGRPFSDVEEMNHTLIQNINDTVSASDRLWILGDVTNRSNTDRLLEIRGQIACKHVHLIYGNHDRRCSQEHIFESVQEYKELKTRYGRVVLFHYPIREWSACHYGSVHLHGHIHSTGEYNTENLRKKYSEWMLPYGHRPIDENLGLRIYDVGVDANSYRPVSMESLAQLMDLKPVK